MGMGLGALNAPSYYRSQPARRRADTTEGAESLALWGIFHFLTRGVATLIRLVDVKRAA